MRTIADQGHDLQPRTVLEQNLRHDLIAQLGRDPKLLVKFRYRQTFHFPLIQFIKQVDFYRLQVYADLLLTIPGLQANHTDELELQS